jgi:DNA-binding LacI/PurR family transcriptional regulator
MSVIRLLSPAEQVAAHLRAKLGAGTFGLLMPGVLRLEAELGVNRNTVEAALRLLEADGLLAPRGPGRRRRILPRRGPVQTRRLRVAVLDYDPPAAAHAFAFRVQQWLKEAGHDAFFADQCLTDLGMKLPQVRRLVDRTEAAAWVVCAASREVLEWFADRPAPAFALFGNRQGLPIAGVGPAKRTAYAEATRALIERGHRRIVLLEARTLWVPQPGESERGFVDEMRAHGIPTGPYNLPAWEDAIEGFIARLDDLFRVSPPTALIVDESAYFVATLNFCANRGIRVPQDVSLVCTDWDPAFSHCRPTVAHIRWDPEQVLRRIVRWANNIASTKDDRRQTYVKAAFVPGGTIGPAPRHNVVIS